jgi:hypothetical protein
MHFPTYALVPPPSVLLVFLPFKSNHLITILQKVRDRLKYHGKLAKTYYAYWAELYPVY